MFGIPVVILITVCVGAVVKSFTDWGWPLALLFGSCLAATDPVSVLPVMRTTGASHAVTILVLGESLLSEGAATVLFHVFENKIEGVTVGFDEILKLFIQEFVLSIALGILGGMIAVWLMSFANQHLRSQDSILQVAISVVCAYFIFYSAQSLFDLSGVLSTCTAAVYVATFAQGVILNHHTFHSIWALLEWAGQTLIFLIAGLILKDKTQKMIRWSHLPKVLALYLVMVSVRATYILLTYKFAGSVSGHRISLKEACFFGFTGLKGAVGMILSLVGYGLADLGYLDQQEADDFIVLSSLVIGLSMFLGGILTRYFIKAIGLRPQDTPESLIVKRYIRSRVRRDVLSEYEIVKEEFANLDITSLMEYSGLLQSEMDDNMNLELDTQLLRQTLTTTYNPSQELNFKLLSHLRIWYLNSVKACYFHHISLGKLPRHSYSAQLLLQSINATLDHEDPTHLGDFEVVLDGLTLNPYLRYFLETMVAPLSMSLRQSWNPVAYLEGQQVKRSAYTWSSFCTAHHHAASVICEFLQDDPNASSTSASAHWGGGGSHHSATAAAGAALLTSRSPSSSFFSPAAAAASLRSCPQIPEVMFLLKQSKDSIERATNLLNLMEPEELTKIYENQAAKMLLNKEASLISTLSHDGMITPQDSEKELKRINADLGSIEKLRKAHSRYTSLLPSLPRAHSSALSLSYVSLLSQEAHSKVSSRLWGGGRGGSQ
jgi:monovalent cation:H+ antiporter, CPA1 family